MKSFVKFHITPFIISFLITLLLITIPFFYSKESNPSPENIIITEDTQSTSFRHFANYNEDGRAKIIFLAKSLSEKRIVLFGSSELTDDERTPYHFFNDSVLKVVGIGGAYNETFSIYCQLLAMGEYARNGNVCIILSPGWFEDGEGTNIQAFLEYVPELLQKRIWVNEIEDEYKKYVYSYMQNHRYEINLPALSYSLLANLGQSVFMPQNNKILANKFLPRKVDLKFTHPDSSPCCKGNFVLSWDSMLTKDYAHFYTTCDSNNIYVYNKYYFVNALNSDGTPKSVSVPVVPFPNRELDDFKMLLKLLRYYNCKASFIMEPLNPYYYHSLENYKPVMDSIHQLITDQYHYPYLDMFVTDTTQYHPGDLMDVMHLGRAGWDKVNRFIYQTYCNNSTE